jgi:ribosomal protein S18 acetylase RimI-like enzyme
MLIRIRRFRRADLDSLMEIERACFPKAAYPRDMFLELYKACGGLFLVANISDSMAGYSVVCVRPPRAELVSIAVAPTVRRSGVAQALLQQTLVRLRRAGILRLSLMVRSRNRAAIRLYRGFGFRHKGRVAGYYENGEDGIRMTLTLG